MTWPGNCETQNLIKPPSGDSVEPCLRFGKEIDNKKTREEGS